MLTFLIASILAFLIGVAGGILALHRFAESDKFRLLVSAKLSQALQIEGEFASIQWKGWQAYSAGFQATGIRKNPIVYLTAANITSHLDWSALPRRLWRLHSSQIDSLEVQLDWTSLLQSSSQTAMVGTPSPTAKPYQSNPDKKDLKLPKFGFIPDKFVFDGATFQNVKVQLRDAIVQNSRVHLQAQKNGYQLLGSGGDVILFQSEVGNLSNWTVYIQDKKVSFDVPNAIFTAGGNASVSGVSENQTLLIHSQWNALPLRVFLSRLPIPLDGKANGEAIFQSAPNSSWKCTGKVVIPQPRLHGQKALAQFLALPEFLASRLSFQVPLQSVESEFEVSTQGVALRNCVISGGEVFRAEGDLFINPQQQLQGEFLVGLPSSALGFLPAEKAQEIFPLERDNLRWAKMQISGTSMSPREDLSKRILDGLLQSFKMPTNLPPATDGSRPADVIRETLNLLLPLIQ